MLREAAASDCWELELHVVVSYATQVLGAQRGPSARAGCTLTLEPSPQPSKLHFKGLSRDATPQGYTSEATLSMSMTVLRLLP